MNALLWKTAPGELSDALVEPFTLSDADLTPAVGGCGRALVTAAQLLTGEDTEEATGHLEACQRCREALIGIGHLAGGIDALVYFERVHNETPYATPAKAVA